MVLFENHIIERSVFYKLRSKFKTMVNALIAISLATRNITVEERNIKDIRLQVVV